jgi:hypothetical protein
LRGSQIAISDEGRAHVGLLVALGGTNVAGTRRPVAADADVHAAVLIRAAAGQASDLGAVPFAAVDDRRDAARDLAPDIPQLQRPVLNRYGVRIVRIGRLANEVEGRADAQPRDDVLALLERDADDLRVEIDRLADRRVAVALQKLGAPLEQ